MSAEGDDVEEFLAFLSGPTKPKAPVKVLDHPEGGDDVETFLEALAGPSKPKVSVKDPQSVLAFVRSRVKDVDEEYILWLADRTSDEFFVALFQVASARACFVRDQILRNRSVTTSEIAKEYNHPPRAAGDLSDAGIPLRTERTKDASGSSVVRYTFDPQSFEEQRENRGTQPARETFLPGRRCALCPSGVSLKWRLLQVDHRVPFSRVRNKAANLEGDAAFQALCPSHNAEKREACAKCKCSEDECRSCYYAYPEKYTHIGGQIHRVLTVVATSDGALTALSKVAAQAEQLGCSVRLGVHPDSRVRASGNGVSVQEVSSSMRVMPNG